MSSVAPQRASAAFLCSGLLLLAGDVHGRQEEPSAEHLDFFESKVRPVLVENCYTCHNSHDRTEAGLALDHRAGWQRGGGRRSVIAPGRPRASRLILAVRSSDLELRMPLGGAALEPEVIADLEKWIAMGAPDPRDQPPTAEQHAATTSWDAIRKQRMSWWSFQPIQSPEPPLVTDESWQQPVDRFIKRRLEDAQLAPSELADARSLMRRLRFALTGLPPTPDESRAFVAAVERNRESAIDDTVERLMGSQQFGERWARHWMDWVRFAETHGAETDPEIPYAFRYRDYLIRALNDDVPYAQLVREHIAGDQLREPRLSADGNTNESALGTAQLRFVIHGHSPTDALDEQVRFTDNQIDVISKAFLGLTVSCARCHDHKFDPISQTDFYALYGVMASSRPGIRTLDTAEHGRPNAARMNELKSSLRSKLAGVWLEHLALLPKWLRRESGSWRGALRQPISSNDPLYAWQILKRRTGRDFEQGWHELRAAYDQSRGALKAQQSGKSEKRWPLQQDADFTAHSEWFTHGTGFDSSSPISGAGFFDLEAEGDRIVTGLRPSGIYSHRLSTKHSATVSSSRFDIEGDNLRLYVRVAGDGGAAARYVVQNYPTGGETYPIAQLKGAAERWIEWDLSYWDTDHAYIELTTAADRPIGAQTVAERSWFGITGAVLVREGQITPRIHRAEATAPLFDQGVASDKDSGPTSARELAKLYASALRNCIEAWRDDRMTDAQARFLGAFVRRDLLPNTTTALRHEVELLADLERYRSLESMVPVPRRMPGVLDGTVYDQPLMQGGNHKQLGDPVPRRFLESFDPTPFGDAGAGRLDLAERILDPSNPLAARVIVNRVWHHVFGSGLVATPDNLGRMGEEPSHPELLDYLATRFINQGWSIKRLVGELLRTRTFQLSSIPSDSQAQAEEDPGNRLLAHAPVRRLEAEAIRDAMLLAGRRLDLERFGPSVAGSVPRRSVYVEVARYRLDPFLATFDSPTPVSTVGRRDQTNVPAHSLALMNSPFVIRRAREFAIDVTDALPDGDERSVIAEMYRRAFGRPPAVVELERSLEFLARVRSRPLNGEHDQQLSQKMAAYEQDRTEVLEELDELLERTPSLRALPQHKLLSKYRPRDMARLQRKEEEVEQLRLAGQPLEPWSELARALFSMKEFIYLR